MVHRVVFLLMCLLSLLGAHAALAAHSVRDSHTDADMVPGTLRMAHLIHFAEESGNTSLSMCVPLCLLLL